MARAQDGLPVPAPFSSPEVNSHFFDIAGDGDDNPQLLDDRALSHVGEQGWAAVAEQSRLEIGQAAS